MTLPMPKSRGEILDGQRTGKRRAVENAMRAPFFKGKLDHIDLDRLDDDERMAQDSDSRQGHVACPFAAALL